MTAPHVEIASEGKAAETEDTNSLPAEHVDSGEISFVTSALSFSHFSGIWHFHRHYSLSFSSCCFSFCFLFIAEGTLSSREESEAVREEIVPFVQATVSSALVPSMGRDIVTTASPRSSANVGASSTSDNVVAQPQPPVASSTSGSSGPSSSLAPVAVDVSDSVALKELLGKIKGSRLRSFDSYHDFAGVGTDLAPIEGMRCSIPSILHPWIDTVKKAIPNFSIQATIHGAMLSPVVGHLCCVVREMASTAINALSDDLLFKWYDLIQDASRLGFDTSVLVGHIESLARSYVESLSSRAAHLIRAHKLNEKLVRLHSSHQELSRKLESISESITKLEAEKESLQGLLSRNENAGLRL